MLLISNFNTTIMKTLKSWKTVVLITYSLVYYHGLVISSAANNAVNQTSLADQRAAAGFISIDCGMSEDSRYDQNRGLYYSSDSEFINTGKNYHVTMADSFSDDVSARTLRSFPDGSRNCYTLKPLQGKNYSYLIRAFFSYGNYDGLNRFPAFDLYIGVNRWATVAEHSGMAEIIYAPPSDFVYVCLVNTGTGTPFITTLELRPLNNLIYKPFTGALITLLRMDCGIAEYGVLARLPSAADDLYDRIWSGDPPFVKWDSLSTNMSSNIIHTDAYEVPPSVLKTAVKPSSGGGSLAFTIPVSSLFNYYVYWHFAEIEKLGLNDSREFTISMEGSFYSKVISPKYLKPLTIASRDIPINGTNFEFSIDKTNGSTLPPILNALEVYGVLSLPASTTNQEDVDAIMNLKMKYSVKRAWQGDPCLPHPPWDGLNCSNNGDDPPRIISLNLTFDGLAGDIPQSLSALTELVYLNLSHNWFTGFIPDYLAQLPALSIIDLRSNNLTGLVPAALNRKVEEGSLYLRLDDNPYLCVSNPCHIRKKNSKKIVVILAAIAVVTFILTAIAVFTYKQKKRATDIKSTTQLKSRDFTHLEIVNITTNFKKIIGKGGSATVYHGCLQDATPVAVKLLKSCTEGSSNYLKLFRTEVEVLTRVYHKNLVSLIGYCQEGTTMALIYEYVANGTLQQHLLEKTLKVLSWKDRLQIAIDAATGLEYLHSGCRSPVIHRDMKTSNILLDEKLRAKITDFGISRTFSSESESAVITGVAGTYGYLDPQYYYTRRLNEKTDVYSFGVVLLELITGRPPIIIDDSSQPINLAAWVAPKLQTGDINNIVDKRLQGNFSANSAWKALEIAMMCVSSTAIQRPRMNQVLSDLKDCFDIEIAQGRYMEETSQVQRGYGCSTAQGIDDEDDIAVPDSSIEMGPVAR